MTHEFTRYIQRRHHGISGFSPQNFWQMRQLHQTHADAKALSPQARETTWTGCREFVCGGDASLDLRVQVSYEAAESDTKSILKPIVSCETRTRCIRGPRAALTYPSVAGRQIAHPHPQGDVRSSNDRPLNERKPGRWH